ncbi:alpha/beta fold hydrolase [Tessaracoccus sp. MC1756]|uniref:alpha/beta fold hydrolase n=1 Tax=Tessaracoccus sp. MC1756 TaxID=2760311 RepID=UPI0015FEEFA6|nr:alpha/beta fold hydrolase [Tessaracoccus sp. MC1756]
MTTSWVSVPEGRLAVTAEGSGEAVLVVQTALSVDETASFSRHELVRGHFRVITFDRRGYGSSTTTRTAPATIESDALDCLAVLETLDAVPAHVIGVSYSAAVALHLASLAPAAVRSVVAIEPPPRHAPSATDFVTASRRLMDVYEHDGAAAALEAFMVMLVGPDWRRRQEALAPGSVERIERDAAAFFGRDIPALLTWRYGPDEAVSLGAPVLYVGGTDSGPMFRQTKAWVRELFPDVQTVSISGAGHDLALTHPTELAIAVSRFLHWSRRPGA